MKPSPRHDFPISVRRQEWEEEPAVAGFYHGIFEVLLNHTIDVMFVPWFERKGPDWPPVLPENADAITSEREARLLTVALSNYGVTPDAARAGQEEVFLHESAGEPSQGVLFYVTPEEFMKMGEELSRLAEERPAVHDEWRGSEIEDLAVTRFLLSRFVVSPYLPERHRELLGR